MPVFILPFEVFETAADSFTSFLNFTLSSDFIPMLIGLNLFSGVLISFLRALDFELKFDKKSKKKKDKITLKQMIMRFIGFDHFKEKEDNYGKKKK